MKKNIFKVTNASQKTRVSTTFSIGIDWIAMSFGAARGSNPLIVFPRLVRWHGTPILLRFCLIRHGRAKRLGTLHSSPFRPRAVQ